MKRLAAVDPVLATLVVTLTLFGLLMLTSASSVVAFERYGDAYALVKNQLVAVALGFAALWVGSRVSHQWYRKQAALFLLVSIALLVAVLIPGLGTRLLGAQRWLNLGPLSFQPSELVKLTLLLYLAAWLERRRLHDQSGATDLKTFLILMSVVGGLILLQPDMGTLMVLLLIALAVYFTAGAAYRHMGVIVGLGLLAVLLAIVVAPYRLQRFTTFLNPTADPQGEGYHITQALIAVGSGGLGGLGLGHSRQKFNYLPEASADSIFAIVGEELGFFVSVGLVVVYLALALRGFRIANAAPDGFGRSVAVGITVWLCGQAFLNIAALTGLLPLTGIPLPLVSYGGTSLVVLLFAVGILLNISRSAPLHAAKR